MAFLSEEKVHIARQIMALQIDKKIEPKFLKYYLITQIDYLKAEAKSMIPGIARTDVISLPFPLPPLEEQKRIVTALDKAKSL